MKKVNNVRKKYIIIIAFTIGLIALFPTLLPTNMRYFTDINLTATGYAKETRKEQYLIKFHSNCEGDTSLKGTMEDEIMNYIDDRNLTKNTFDRSDYKFAEWNTKADGTGDTYIDEQEITHPTSYVPENEINLYAQWKEKILVTFDANEGTIPESQEGYWTGSGPTASKRIEGTTYEEMPTQ